MAQTLQNLRDEIYADLPQIAGQKRFPTTRLNRYINEAQWFVQVELNGLGMKKWEFSASLTLSAATIFGISVKQASVPIDILESPTSILGIDCVTGWAWGPGVDINAVAQKWISTTETPTATQPEFCRLSGKIDIFPSSISSATIYYLQRLPSLALDNDTISVPDEFVKFVIQHAEDDVRRALGELQNIKQAEAEIAKNIAEQVEKFYMRENTAQYIRQPQKSTQLQ